MIHASLNSNKKVLIDSRLMFYRKAGISNYTRALVKALAQIEHQQVSVAILLDRRDTDIEWVPQNVGIIRAFTPAHHRFESFLLPFELQIIKLKTAFDILHSPDFITARGKFKKVVTVHDLYFYEHPEVMSADGARYYGRVRWSCIAAHAIIAVSHFTRDDIVRLLPAVDPNKIHIIYEAADIAPRSQNTAFIKTNQPYALFIGTFEPRKNIITLLKAIAFLRDRALLPANFKVVIAGATGWVGDAPSQLAGSLQVAQYIAFRTGHINAPELDDLYTHARMLILPSLYEGFGLTALEAMARATPVVCSCAGSLPEVVGDAALLHDPLDYEWLGQHILTLWHDDSAHHYYAQRGLARAGQFSWAKTASETSDLYLTI
jgi:glycosyltransferase involved in cell wall biosynthesis